MEYTRLGSTGLKVSRICLGMMSYGSSSWRDWVLDLDGARPLVRSAVEAGVIFFDTADVYSLGASEEITGTLLREFFRSRDDYVLATKVWGPMPETEKGLSADKIAQQIDASLARLRTDHVDLYQAHRFDPSVPIEETLGWSKLTSSAPPTVSSSDLPPPFSGFTFITAKSIGAPLPPVMVPFLIQ